MMSVATDLAKTYCIAMHARWHTILYHLSAFKGVRDIIHPGRDKKKNEVILG
jgi:hypothetical protein